MPARRGSRRRRGKSRGRRSACQQSQVTAPRPATGAWQLRRRTYFISTPVPPAQAACSLAPPGLPAPFEVRGWPARQALVDGDVPEGRVCPEARELAYDLLHTAFENRAHHVRKRVFGGLLGRLRRKARRFTASHVLLLAAVVTALALGDVARDPWRHRRALRAVLPVWLASIAEPQHRRALTADVWHVIQAPRCFQLSAASAPLGDAAPEGVLLYVMFGGDGSYEYVGKTTLVRARRGGYAQRVLEHVSGLLDTGKDRGARRDKMARRAGEHRFRMMPALAVPSEERAFALETVAIRSLAPRANDRCLPGLCRKRSRRRRPPPHRRMQRGRAAPTSLWQGLWPLRVASAATDRWREGRHLSGDFHGLYVTLQKISLGHTACRVR